MQYKRLLLCVSSFYICAAHEALNINVQQEQVVDGYEQYKDEPSNEQADEQQVRAQVDPTVLSCIAEAIIAKYCPGV